MLAILKKNLLQVVIKEQRSQSTEVDVRKTYSVVSVVAATVVVVVVDVATASDRRRCHFIILATRLHPEKATSSKQDIQATKDNDMRAESNGINWKF